MKSGNKAFSLTELMIVLVVIALLFCAIAPVITKRHISETHENESIWNFLSGDSDRNVFFDPGYQEWTSSVYVGMNPPTVSDSNAGKLVIDSGQITHDEKTYASPQMQFRFSKNSSEQGKGINAASLIHSDDIIIFGNSSYIANGNSSTVYSLGTNDLSDWYSYSLMGSQVMGQSKFNSSNTTADSIITAIGHRAGYHFGNGKPTNSVNAIYVGSSAGAGTAEIEDAPTDNIAIGYNSMAAEGAQGTHNVFLGAYTGNGFKSVDSSYNTIVGSAFSRDNASYNTIIGYGVYTSGEPIDTTKTNIKAMTAIGYGACNSLYGSNNGSRVCIGYNSGYSTNNTPESFSTDNGEHIFLGGKPSSEKTSGFAGRSVLEVHNNTVDDETVGNVVINSNLVVRGNFFPSDENGYISYNVFSDTQTAEAEDSYYRCSSDAYQSILSYSSYVCQGLTLSNPKSINLLYKGGNCATSGGYTTGGGCPAIVSSDIRLKTNISPNNDGLEKILQLKPYNFTYKKKPDIPQVGVLAQDLQNVFPNAVSKGKDGFLSIRLEDIMYALVNSIKHLSQKVEDLFAKVADLENDFVLIKNDQKSIEKQVSLLNKRVKKLERK